MYVDDAANQRGLGSGLILVSPEQITIEKSLTLGFSAINNWAEYEVLLEGMSMVQRMGRKAEKMFSDLRLVVDQVNGKLEAKDERMQGHLYKCLNRCLVMRIVLGIDAKGKLTLKGIFKSV